MLLIRVIACAIIGLFFPGASNVSFAQKVAPKASYLRVPFSADKAFNAQFPFHALPEVVGALRKRPMPLKNEFETTEEFNARFSRWESESIYGEISPVSPLALIFAHSAMTLFPSLTYDADRGVMRLRGLAHLCKESQINSGAPYIGSNAFGVRKKIQVVRATNICVDLGARSLDEFDVTFPVEQRSAQALKSNWALVAIGKLKVPYYVETEATQEPTIDYPIELHRLTMTAYFDPSEFAIVDLQAKEVFARIPKDRAIVLNEMFRR